MKAIEGEKFLFLSCLWRLGFRSEFNVWWWRSMERGHVARVDLRVFMAWPLGFPLLFSFLGFLVSKTFLFPSLWFFFLFLLRVFVSFACFCHHSDSAPVTLTLLRRRISPASTIPFSKVHYFFDFSDFFLQGPFTNPWFFFFCLVLLLFLCLIFRHLGLGIPFHG